MNHRRYVILDRDGTIIVERHYLSYPNGVELLTGAAEGLRRMMKMNLGLIVVTNQSGVGRGYFDEDTVNRIHRRLQELLEAEGVTLEGVFYCPHAPEDNCGCRKPKPGLIVKAAGELDFEPHSGFVIGDKACDVELGKNVGATTFLVRTGYGAEASENGEVQPDYIVDDLVEAAGIIEDRLYLENNSPQRHREHRESTELH